jgi:CRP/FNR family transcriptional regulator, cyclic AMP receptor protein
MASATILSEDTQTRYEDILAHLPISKTTEYAKGQMIYGLETFPKSIYLVVKGTVGISHIAEDGTEVLLDIVRPDDLFGESAFLQAPRRLERAEAIQRAELMTWSVCEMEALVTKRPRLAVALLQVLAQRNAEYTLRLESFASDSIARRLARSLLRLSERLGTREESGSVRMMPLTHQMLSRYIGTSREIVSHYMSQFRRHGYVVYSRRGISLHRDTLKTVLD